jgi:hypothetical protein
MVLVTLIGEKLAKEGEEFVYLGPNNECKNCKLKNVCFNLKPKRKYKITKIRDKEHECSVHEGKVVVVEVREIPLLGSVNKKLSEGTRVKVEKRVCKNIDCNHFEICTNIALQKDKSYSIKKVHGRMECPKDLELYKVELID